MHLLATKSAAVKVFASVALVGGAASVAGLGTFGAFTASTSASEAVSTSTLALSSSAGTKGFSVAAAKMVPGDSIQRTLTLTRAATDDQFGAVKVTTTGTTDNLLTSDATNGLQMVIDECSVPWTVSGDALTCTGTTSALVSSKVVGTDQNLGHATGSLNSAGGGNAHLRVTLTLPETAGNTFQGLSNSINFLFNATQRTAKVN